MDQSKIFLEGEGDAFLNRNNKKKFSHDYFKKNGRNVLLEWCLPEKQNISSILEIGAGNGLPLSYLADKLEAQAFGIEPSKKAVQNWEKNKTKINGGENTNLIIGISNNLPFEKQNLI